MLGALETTVQSLRPRLSSPVDPRRSVSAVLFDLDGTLYDQRPLRKRMAAEMGLLPFTRPTRALNIWRGIAAYRRAHESLRLESSTPASPDQQLARAAAEVGLSAAELRPIVQEWMLDRPLKHLTACRAAGLVELLHFLESAGVELGVLSDYPVEKKLRALGIAHHFSIALCSTDPSIGALKPHPRGFLRAAEIWGLPPHDVLVVGDRLDADAAGARAAGMPCVIVSTSRASHPPDNVLIVDSLERLHRVLDRR